MSKQRLKIEGQKFGKLKVVRFFELRKLHSFWLCLCDCGNEAIICGASLKRGKTRSCGCLSPNFIKGRLAEYRAWLDAKYRCYNEKSKYHKIYGGRGIKVCDRWLESFENFYEDMGKRPSKKHQLDRIDNNGDYTPENCRWVTNLQNMRNTSKSKWWYIDGVRYESLPHASKELGVSQGTVKRWCDGRRKNGKLEGKKDSCYSRRKYG